MRITRKIVAIGFIGLAGAAFAGKATEPTVKAWQDAMDANGAAAKVLGEMAGGKAAFDAAKAAEAKAALAAEAAKIPDLFKTQASDPESEAKPEIWANWSDFEAKAKALADAANALDVSSAEAIGAGMGAIGGACKACHQSYRM